MIIEGNKKIKRNYSIGEEIGNAITHGIGTALSIAALVILILKAVKYAPIEHKAAYTTGVTIFGFSLVVLYLFSTLYHALPLGTKTIFGIFDHISIYILIAGTYTGFCLTVLYGTLGWIFFGIIWALAVIGIIFYAIFASRAKVVSVIMYILMGWVIIFAARPLKNALPPKSFILLVSGGVSYTVGCIFYAMKKIKWMHFIWHLFVLAGSLLHFFSLLFSF